MRTRYHRRTGNTDRRPAFSAVEQVFQPSVSFPDTVGIEHELLAGAGALDVHPRSIAPPRFLAMIAERRNSIAGQEPAGKSPVRATACLGCGQCEPSVSTREHAGSARTNLPFTDGECPGRDVDRVGCRPRASVDVRVVRQPRTSCTSACRVGANSDDLGHLKPTEQPVHRRCVPHVLPSAARKLLGGSEQPEVEKQVAWADALALQVPLRYVMLSEHWPPPRLPRKRTNLKVRIEATPIVQPGRGRPSDLRPAVRASRRAIEPLETASDLRAQVSAEARLHPARQDLERGRSWSRIPCGLTRSS